MHRQLSNQRNVDQTACSACRDHEKETIHSGHFMMSNVPQDEEDDGDGVVSDFGDIDDTDAEEARVSTEEGVTGGHASTHLVQDVKRLFDRGGSRGGGTSAAGGRTAHRHSVQAGTGRGPGMQTGMRARSNSESMSEDVGGRSRINLTQKKVIDSSLSKLFQCMSLAYRQKLTSPKWNNFKGLKLRWTIKIRLNNVIWRAWHMQFIKQMRPLIAPFAIEVDSAPHNKSEAVLLEGKYWKRRMSMVSAEYRKWRVWYKNKTSAPQPSTTFTPGYDDMVLEAAGGGNWYPGGMGLSLGLPDEPMNIDDWPFLPDFTDALLARLTNQPFAFPDPREIAQAGNADFIQPGLLQLQPSLEDLMDTLEPLSEYFASQTVGGYNPMSGGFSVTGPSVKDSLQVDPYGTGSDSYWRSPTVSELLSAPSPAGSNLRTPRPMVNPPCPSPANSISPTTYANNTASQSYSTYPMSSQSTSSYNMGASSSGSMTLGSLLVNPAGNSFSGQDNLPVLLQSEMELNKQEMRQRSLSGPTPGNPLIDPGVFAALANYNRSVSASSGNIAQPVFSPGDLPTPAATAPLPPQQQQRTAEKFAVPQMANDGRGRRGKGSRSGLQHGVSIDSATMQPNVPLVQPTQETSTLAQLLTSGTTVLGGGGGGLMTTTPPAKKLAPKPTVPSAAPVAGAPLAETKNRSVPANTFPTTPTALPVQTQHAHSGSLSSPLLSVFESNESSSGLSRMEPVIPKLEFNSLDSSFRMKLEEADKDRPRGTESRRINHITAEQKRRGHIKNGFEVLQGLVPSLAHNPAAKVSKAVVLHKGAEYIHQLKEERRAMQAEAEKLKQQIDAINQAVITCQQQLPATGAPVSSRARNDRLNEMLDEYIRNRTMQNWKFWLFSLIMRPLFDSYSSTVSSRSGDEFCQTAVSWVDQQCTLVQLRPLIKESMRKLSTSTHVLSDPSRLETEARQAVQEKSVSPSSAAYL